MNLDGNFISIVGTLILCVITMVGLYYVTKSILIKKAESEDLFFTVKYNRIVAIVRSGRTVGYVGNLLGTGFHTNEETGEIEEGEAKITSLLWFLFGVRWLGLDRLYKYEFDLTEIDSKGNKVPNKVPAESIYYEGSYPVTIDAAETKDGIPVRLMCRLNLKTKHAGKSLKFPNWLTVVKDPVKAACRDFVSHNKIEEVLHTKYEGDPKKLVPGNTNINDTQSDLLQHILNLNHSGNGNDKLEDLIGQHIVSFHVVEIIIMDEDYKSRIQAPEKARKDAEVTQITAEATALKTVTISEADLEAETNRAKGLATVGDAENRVLKDRLEVLGGNPEHVIGVEKWKSIAGLRELKGTLALGDSTLVLTDRNSAPQGETDKNSSSQEKAGGK